MTERTPPTLIPPAPSVEPEAPLPDAVEASDTQPPKAPRLDPTRYGDWELNGKCVDF